MNSSPILVLGATGKTGRRIAQRLAAKGHTVRKGSRQGDPPFDWQDPGTWSRAVRGAEAVYVSFFPDLALPGAPAAIEEFTAKATAAGVQRMVLLSGRGEPNAQRCEQIVRDSGPSWTLLRASWFSQNFNEGHLLGPIREGMVALPVGDVVEPFVDVDDIADVAVEALTDERHAGQLYELTGPRLLSFPDAVRAVAEASGCEIDFMAISSELYRTALTEHAGPELANLLTDLFSEVLDGRNSWLGDGVQKALGREPRDFADFCRASAATGVWAQ